MHGELIVKVCFEFNKRIIDTIKSIPGRRWNQENRHWYFPERQFNLPSFREALNPLANIDASALKPSPEPIPKETRSPTPPAQNDSFHPPMYMEKLIERRYSPNTIKTYVSYMKSFAEEFQDRPLASVTTRQINEYLLKLIRTRGISASQQNQRISAIKFYYEQVLGRKKAYYQLSRPKKDKKLPKVLTVEEVELILSQVNNLKHKCILMTLYSGGLRRSELINLKISDIDSERMLIRITHSKGNKDRYTLLSEKLPSNVYWAIRLSVPG